MKINFKFDYNFCFFNVFIGSLALFTFNSANACETGLEFFCAHQSCMENVFSNSGSNTTQARFFPVENKKESKKFLFMTARFNNGLLEFINGEFTGTGDRGLAFGHAGTDLLALSPEGVIYSIDTSYSQTLSNNITFSDGKGHSVGNVNHCVWNDEGIHFNLTNGSSATKPCPNKRIIGGVSKFPKSLEPENKRRLDQYFKDAVSRQNQRYSELISRYLQSNAMMPKDEFMKLNEFYKSCGNPPAMLSQIKILDPQQTASPRVPAGQQPNSKPNYSPDSTTAPF